MKRFYSIFFITLIVFFAFFPVAQGKIPLNARNLVALFTPWYYEKFSGFPAGVPSKPGMLDQIRLYYPYMALTQWSYQHGQLPLWNPFNFSGNPHMAEWQSGTFYPLHIFLPFLSLPVYWSLFQVVAFLLSGFFMYWYLRNLSLGVFPGILGAIGYTFCEFMFTWNMEVVTAPHSILWLPLILLSIDRIVSKEQIKKWWIIGLVALVLSVLSGYWQTTLYVMIVAAIYTLHRLLQRRLLFTVYCLLFFLWFPLSLGLTAFHLLPTSELYRRSSRPVLNRTSEIVDIFKGYLLPPEHLITLVSPNFFGHPTTRNYFAKIKNGTYYEHVLSAGTIPFVLAVYALFFVRKQRRDVLFWFLVSAVTASFSFQTPWANAVFDWQVPVLSTGIANRILFVLPFGLSVMAAIGLEQLYLKTQDKAMRHAAVVAFGLVLALLGALIFLQVFVRNPSLKTLFADDKVITNKVRVSTRNSILPLLLLFGIGSVWMLASIRPVFGKIALVATVILSGFQGIYQFRKFTAFSEMQFVYPTHPAITWLRDHAEFNRFTGYNGTFLNNNFATFFQIYSAEGYDSLNDYRRTMLFHSSREGKLDPLIARSADVMIEYDLTNPHTLQLFQLLGIRYLVDHPEWLDVGPTQKFKRLPHDQEQLVFEDGDWRIWDYLSAFPRAYFVGAYEQIDNDETTIARLFSDNFDRRNAVILSKPVDAEFLIANDPDAFVKITEYTPTKITFSTFSKKDQLLFLSDTWYPGWHAKLEDGRRLPVLVADFALRSVPVPAGEHTVTMWYFPDSFRNGIFIALGTLVITVFSVRRFQTKQKT